MDTLDEQTNNLNIDEQTGAAQPNLGRPSKPTKAEMEANQLLYGEKPKVVPPPPPPQAEPMPPEASTGQVRARTLHNHDKSHTTQPSSSRVAATWLGRTAKKLHLNKVATKHRLKYLGIGLVSFAVFAVIFNAPVIISQVNYLFNPPKAQESVKLPTEAKPASTSQAEVVPPENVVIIPKINSTAPLILEPSQQEKNIQIALRDGVVHYAGTAVPGEIGNVVIVGHSSNDWWEPGNYKFVFALLDKLAVGDKVQINYSSRKYVYEVVNTKVVAPTDLSVLNQTSEPTLTLITCTPPGTSWKRLIVTAKQIEPMSAPESKPQLAASESIKSANLPGNAPSFGAQISGFFNKIIAFFNPNKYQNDSSGGSQPTQDNQNQLRLPEVS